MRLIASRRGENSGFTLIELMVVMTLIAIMAAAIIPEMRGTYEDALLRASSRQWMDVMSLAYSRAVTVNQPCRVRLDRTKGQYFVERRVTTGGDPTGFAPIDDSASSGTIDSRITVEFRSPGQDLSDDSQAESSPTGQDDGSLMERDETIAFYPDGTADAREILLQDRDGFRLALRINPTTARVQIVELDRK